MWQHKALASTPKRSSLHRLYKHQNIHVKTTKKKKKKKKKKRTYHQRAKMTPLQTLMVSLLGFIFFTGIPGNILIIYFKYVIPNRVFDFLTQLGIPITRQITYQMQQIKRDDFAGDFYIYNIYFF